MEKQPIILRSDSYKYTQYPQYPLGTTEVYSYFESRGGKFEDVVFYGLQYYLKEYLAGTVVTNEDIDKAEKIINTHIGNHGNIFNREGWEYIVEHHNGKLPIEIKAVPEGTPVSYKNVLMTIVNTDPKCYWLTNFLETLLVKVWYPCTVATYSREVKKIIKRYLEDTGCENIMAELLFKFHSFGYRGVSSEESACIGGSSHLVNFMGTDDVIVLSFIMDYYNTNDIVGFSIPASEHSTITSWGRLGELNAYRNMLEVYPTGTIACVSDSFDIYNACWELWGTELRDQILNRDGVLVVRPDSGDPATVCLKVINILGDRFGFAINSKGYKVLNPHIRIIQGDGVNIDTIEEILKVFKNAGWAAENIAFGCGGSLLQKHDRDEQKFAFKCSNVIVAGNDVLVFKNPVTDPGKMSKSGRLKLVKVEGRFDTHPEWSDKKDLLETVFLNGEIVKEYTFEEIRKNAAL